MQLKIKGSRCFPYEPKFERQTGPCDDNSIYSILGLLVGVVYKRQKRETLLLHARCISKFLKS